MKKNNIEKWNIDYLHDFPSTLYIEGLHDDYEGFRILVKGGKPSKVYRISFDCHLGYRNFDESERLKSLTDFPCNAQEWCLFKSNNSSFIEWLVSESFEASFDKKEVTHYFVATPNDIVEVLATCEPKIEKL